MWKSTTTKVFIGFSILVLVISFSLSLLFGRLLLQQQETYIFDLLASRSRLAAADISKLLQENKSPEEIVFGKDLMLLSANSNLLSGKENHFSGQRLREVAPATGSLVTACHDEYGNKYLCSFVPLANTNYWYVDKLPQQSFAKTLVFVFNRISPALALFLFFGLVLAFIFSRILLSSLHRFVRATQMIADGEYEKVELPSAHTGEIGQLSKAFQRMILDLKDRERNLARTGLKLAHSARLASIGQMGASIAHEIKNPLAAMLGHAKILSKNLTDSQNKESAEIIWKESERCSQIIQQMLRFSRNDTADKKAFQISDLLNSSLLLIKAEASKKQIQIQMEGKTDVLVFGNPQQVQQVLLNLLMNSIHALQPGGKILIYAHELQSYLCLDFQDNGPGIPADLQVQIFEPFFTTKEKGEGTGLGLSIAQNLMEDQAGSLELLESKPGKTLFRVKIPLFEAASALDSPAQH